MCRGSLDLIWDWRELGENVILMTVVTWGRVERKRWGIEERDVLTLAEAWTESWLHTGCVQCQVIARGWNLWERQAWLLCTVFGNVAGYCGHQ